MGVMAVMLSWWALMAVVGSLCAGWVSVFWRLVRGFAVGVTAVVMTSDRPVWCSGRFNWLLPPNCHRRRSHRGWPGGRG